MLNEKIEGMLTLFELEEGIEESTLNLIKYYLLSTTNYDGNTLKNLINCLSNELINGDIKDLAKNIAKDTKNHGIISFKIYRIFVMSRIIPLNSRG
jgi:hypothetical protein